MSLLLWWAFFQFFALLSGWYAGDRHLYLYLEKLLQELIGQLHDRTSELSKIEAVYNVNWARGAMDGAASLKMKRTDF